MYHLLNWKKSLPVAASSEYQPFADLSNELNKTLREFNNLWKNSSFEEININPLLDIVEDDKKFKIEVEMPGMGEEDIKVSVRDRMLIIKDEKKISRKNKDKNYLSREIKYGYYERNIMLPEQVDINRVTASFKKGMLWVTIPKKTEYAQATKPIKIEKAESSSS